MITLRGLNKSFGATHAVKDVSFTLEAGEVHALVGENGAGKSTLMNMMAGVLTPDSGHILLQDTPRALTSTLMAARAGIATVFQELSLVDGLSVAENICAGHAPVQFGLIDSGAMARRATDLLHRLGTDLPVWRPVGSLLAGQRQLVEIAKAIGQLYHPEAAVPRPVRALILDEPTSALTADEKLRLFAAVRELRLQGVGIIYISHHLSEVVALADRITVLRDGATVWTRPAAGLTTEDLVSAMVGREVLRAPRDEAVPGPEMARLEGVTRAGQVRDLTLSIRGGEVLGVAGLDGSGRETVARLLAGVELPEQGRITLAGAAHPGTLRRAMSAGVAYVPDDRKTLGLFLDLSIAANAVVTDLTQVARAGMMREALIHVAGVELIADQGVKAAGPDMSVRSLSGGNQQKVLLGKWLRRAPRLLVVEEPTKGVDIGAKQDIHMRIAALAREGAAVVIVSSDLPEILELSDRIAVMHRGRLTGIVDARSATEESVMALASGLVEDAA
ncbi:sugar ABC transporter ATP-binding protein [Tabrizicola sp. J26]|uniref:sugar ABC transporter ATP-binding protein n=1 Tax=Alitabrizicola rongguiensis TaxID=2909234 RepID=UPI001F407649|nr:sugar ABC transporter ATP-binding protein [Tabrizicola rongguiensis]MCF1711147.1 sugar ABC transporter ATP-binding protein [Tabrizicola rongguiensis]